MWWIIVVIAIFILLLAYPLRFYYKVEYDLENSFNMSFYILPFPFSDKGFRIIKLNEDFIYNLFADDEENPDNIEIPEKENAKSKENENASVNQEENQENLSNNSSINNKENISKEEKSTKKQEKEKGNSKKKPNILETMFGRGLEMVLSVKEIADRAFYMIDFEKIKIRLMCPLDFVFLNTFLGSISYINIHVLLAYISSKSHSFYEVPDVLYIPNGDTIKISLKMRIRSNGFRALSFLVFLIKYYIRKRRVR